MPRPGSGQSSLKWLDQLTEVWQYALAGLTLRIALVGSAHALLHKRDPRAATLWVGFIWFVPLFGAVDILLPARSNLPFVQWASTAHWWQVLERGCRIWLSPPPFDHSKLFLVDDCWALVGSTNWDARSLRLNFEFNVECYNPDLARVLAGWFDEQLGRARQTSLAEGDARSLLVRLRDATARLLTPYL